MENISLTHTNVFLYVRALEGRYDAFSCFMTYLRGYCIEELQRTF